ncbi:MAG: coenzyme F420-0:L-glutamate ligase [Eubacteriales bacterium]|nr:coenzyme F420-0:L-glutamate ligase [Clostridiales bacterium]MDY5836409.1 coenzyme F420-0:L-glutamate ligase [Eubacteriales bacterium]
MNRFFGTVARGLRSPIINEGDNLLTIVPQLLKEAGDSGQLIFRDRDVLCITESIVGRSQGNYASIEDIADDVRKKFGGKQIKSLGLVYPIMSRNRFAILLKALALAADEVVLLLSYPSDEVGNAIFDPELIYKSHVNPWQDVLDEETLRENFGPCLHPFTGIDYVKFYREIIEESGAKAKLIFSNKPEAVLQYTKQVIACDIHTRKITKQHLREAGADKVLSLTDILNEKTSDHGYNEDYGLLGSNKADEDRVKLFPRDCQVLVDKLAQELYDLTGKHIEVMIYGDGAFKDPVGKIWELADPVVSPAHTPGLTGKPNEIKIKYLADSQFHGLSAEEQAAKIVESIKHKDDDLVGKMQSEGTTPRQYTDLLGSMADLVSGSGDKGTPFVYIQGYFDSYADN